MTKPALPAAFAGVDWATEKHDVCLVDPTGRVLGERTFPNNAVGLSDMAKWLTEKADAPTGQVFIAIEVPHGPVVESLVEHGFPVHCINPRQLDRFRDRFTMAGAKDDRRDARVLADSLRTDPRACRLIELDHPAVIELREWSRIMADLTQEKVRLCNRARQQLSRYFPQVLALGDDLGQEWMLELLELIPTPDAAHRRRNSTVASLLKRHRIRRLDASQVLTILREPALPVAPGTAKAAIAHLKLLSQRIRLTRQQISECEDQLDACLARVGQAMAPARPGAAEPDGGQEGEELGRKDEPNDVTILMSLPGVGRIVAATLLAEASRPLRERDYQTLRAQSGLAPVTRRSGKCIAVSMRRGCNQRLRRVVYFVGMVASQFDANWQLRYQALRAKGHSHGRACRTVADSLMRVAVAMLRSRTCYQPEHIRVGRAA